MTAVIDQPRTLHVEHCMGTVFSIDVRGHGHWAEAVGDVVAWLHRVDMVFSTYRSDSDISRISRGQLAVDDADPDVALVLDLCQLVEEETEGAFTTHWNPAVDPDPTGLVKGWAIEQAGHILAAHGSRNHAVNGGGDIQMAGGPAPGQPWRVGISDPFDRTRLLAVVSGRDLAVATSGTAERGAHIVGAAAAGGELAGVTVVGPSLTRADAYATAAFAMGPRCVQWLEALPDHEGLVVFADGKVAATMGFPAADVEP